MGSDEGYTRAATWDDVTLLARLLRAEDVRYALIGGYALAAHGLVRFSEDVDVLVAPDEENTVRWIRALSQLPDHAARELEGETQLFSGDGPYAIRINDAFTIDVMGAACGYSWNELEPYIEEKLIDGEPLKLLNAEGLLLTKQGMRDKDRADARALRAFLEQTKK